MINTINLQWLYFCVLKIIVNYDVDDSDVDVVDGMCMHATSRSVGGWL